MILNPGDIAIDYSFARPSPQAIAAAGVRLVVRYISPTRSNKKNLTVAERDALLAAGLSILLVWENSTTDPLHGHQLGVVHGSQARNFATDLGYPVDMPIIVACDFDVQAAQLPVVLLYLAGFKEGSRWAQGAYGKDLLITAAHDAGVSTLGWQTVAWSGGRKSPHADCLQHAKPTHPSVPPLGAVDDNTVLRQFRAWSLAPDPQPQPPQEDDDVITQADIYKAEENPGDKFVLMREGTFRPISETELNLLGIPLTLELGKPATKADRDALGPYLPCGSNPAAINAINDAVGRLGQNQAGAANELKRAAEALAGGG